MCDFLEAIIVRIVTLCLFSDYELNSLLLLLYFYMDELNSEHWTNQVDMPQNKETKLYFSFIIIFYKW